MVKNTSIKEIKKKIMPILRKYGVKKAGIFGSVVRGKATQKSDVDILVEIKRDISLLDFVRLQLEIEKVLGSKVDLGEYDTIKPIIKDRILKEQVSIL